MSIIALRSMRNASFFQQVYLSQASTTQRFIKTSCLQMQSVPHRFSSTTAAIQSATSEKSSINGPITTLPAPLIIPERKPNQSFFPSYAFTLGKAYLAFYKTGVKNIYANFVASRPVQRVVDSTYSGSLSDAVTAGALSRSDFQLLVRSWHDIKRVPIFALVFMICGEFTPLVVIAISNVVPWTCRIPKQINGDRTKLEQRRSISFRNLILDARAKDGVEHMTRMYLLHISWSLGLSSKAWDWLGGQLPGLPDFILRRKVARRLQYLDLDDKLIRDGDGVEEMSEEEVKMALVERGVDVLGKGTTRFREDLTAWLRSREKASAETLLLTRPSVWPIIAKNLNKDESI